jgi:CRISPR-associated protein Csm4
MAKWQLIKLDFKDNPVHFGEVGIGLEVTSEYLHSDTFFSAWVSAYAQLYSDQQINHLFDQFLTSSPPFQISSTFVYGQDQNNECIYYLPSLLQHPRNYPADDLKFAKDFRKLKFLPLTVWRRWYQGSGFDLTDAQELETKPEQRAGQLTTAGTFNYSQNFKKQVLPKVAVDRIHQGTNFYHTGFTYFQPDSGLYFLFHMPTADQELLEQLQASLSLLADDGIGGERSSGAGRFEATWHDLPPEWDTLVHQLIEQPSYALISLFWDQPETCMELVTDQDARYQLKERGGWISARSGRQLRRKSVRMFTEGSVFTQQPQGQLAIVTPHKLQDIKHHPIYRSGISLSLPVSL